MESDELRFRHIGLSSDGSVIFCEMDNGKTFAMPLGALDRGEDWDPKAKPKAAGIIHDGYAAVVKFNTGVTIDFPSDFVLHVCDPSYTWYKDKGRAVTGVGNWIRKIRQSRGLTLEGLAAKCGIAKPNLSRLENGKVTPTLATLQTIAAAMNVDLALVDVAEQPAYAWTWTRHQFGEWSRGLSLIRASNGLQRSAAFRGSRVELISAVKMVEIFLARWPEHRYAREKLLAEADPGKHLSPRPRRSCLHESLLEVDADKWAQEQAEAEAAQPRAKCGKE